MQRKRVPSWSWFNQQQLRLESWTWKVHFCASPFLTFWGAKRDLLCRIVLLKFSSLEACLEDCLEACPEVFGSNFMLSRRWSSRLALRLASNFISAYKLLFGCNFHKPWDLEACLEAVSLRQLRPKILARQHSCQLLQSQQIWEETVEIGCGELRRGDSMLDGEETVKVCGEWRSEIACWTDGNCGNSSGRVFTEKLLHEAFLLHRSVYTQKPYSTKTLKKGAFTLIQTGLHRGVFTFRIELCCCYHPLAWPLCVVLRFLVLLLFRWPYS